MHNIHSPTQVGWPGFKVTVKHQGHWIETGGHELDPNWCIIDGNGHAHGVASADDPDGRFPTLQWVTQPCYLGHGDDCTSEGYWVCRECGETIKPGTRPTKPFWVEGPTVYQLEVAPTPGNGNIGTVYEFGPAEWDQLRSAIETAAAEVLAGCVVARSMEPA